MTHEEFAKKLKVSVRTIFRWENGESNPTKEALQKMANLVGHHLVAVIKTERSTWNV